MGLSLFNFTRLRTSPTHQCEQITKYDDPHEAALAVCAEAYNLWLQFETRTDDITCIIVFFTGMEEETAASQQASLSSG